MTIHEQVVTILVDRLGVEPEFITMRASLVHDLGADSLDVDEILIDLEAACGVDISDADAMELAAGTVGALLNYLEARVQGQTRQEGHRG